MSWSALQSLFKNGVIILEDVLDKLYQQALPSASALENDLSNLGDKHHAKLAMI